MVFDIHVRRLRRFAVPLGASALMATGLVQQPDAQAPVPLPDLVLSVSASPNPVLTESAVRYTIYVNNSAATRTVCEFDPEVGSSVCETVPVSGAATGVRLLHTLPSGVTGARIINAGTFSCTAAGSSPIVITCSNGTIEADLGTQVVVEASAPALPGAITATSQVALPSGASERSLTNNSATVTTTVNPAPGSDVRLRQQFGVSILTVNLLGALNVPRDSSTGVPWRTRYSRIFQTMAQTGRFPDLIALQEAVSYVDCPTDPRRLVEYEAIDFLLRGIRDASGEQYRVAYLTSGPIGGTRGDDWMGGTPSGGCWMYGDRALLYRPSRLRNAITVPPRGVAALSSYRIPLLSTYLAKSAQCCSMVGGSGGACTAIDGPLVQPPFGEYEVFRGTCPTPLGVAFSRSRRATYGVDRTRPHADAVFTRLELVNQPGNFIHVYNVHRGWNQDWEDQHPGVPAPQVLDFGSQNINQLVTDVENRFRSSGPTLYPPILVGDFNVGPPSPGEVFPPLTSYFPRFDVGFFFGIDGVMFGKRSDFPSRFPAFANAGESFPKLLEGEACDTVPNKLWSDHCGVFLRVEPLSN